ELAVDDLQVTGAGSRQAIELHAQVLPGNHAIPQRHVHESLHEDASRKSARAAGILPAFDTRIVDDYRWPIPGDGNTTVRVDGGIALGGEVVDKKKRGC